MASWWKIKGWPWLKENWWAILLFPLAILIWAMSFFRPKVVVHDPTKEADERAKVEVGLRAKVEELERRRLARKVTQLEMENAQLAAGREAQLGEVVEELRKDPEKLKDLMVRVGPGDKP